MKSYDIIGWTFEADYHCDTCTMKRFPELGEDSDATVEDREGNEIYPLFCADVDGEMLETGVYCGDCGAELVEPEPEEEPETTAPWEWAGAVSEGTCREEDLIPRFLDVLRELSPWKHGEFTRLYPEILDQQGTYLGPFTSLACRDAEEDCLVALFEALEELASSEGYYFGAAEGDGACYGFWKVEEEE